MSTVQTHQAAVGSQVLDLPIVEIAEGLGVALLITVDHGVRFVAVAGRELAEELRPSGVEIVVSLATMGIPLAIETTRALGLDDYVILHKTKKIHLADGEWESVRSITTDTEQAIGFDRARLDAVRGRRVGIVDDVISTGGSIVAALNLVRRIGGIPVALGCLVTEGDTWRDALGEDVVLVRSLGSIPLFDRSARGAWQPS